MKKKLYMCTNICCDEDCIAVVASTAKEALVIARLHESFAFCDYVFINTRARLMKGIDISKLEFGEVDYEEGLKLGIYAYAYGIDCEVCLQTTDENNKATLVHGKIMCDDCESGWTEESCEGCLVDQGQIVANDKHTCELQFTS